MSNERMETMLSQLIQMVGSMRKEMSEKFEEVHARFEDMDARFEGIDARFESIDAKFEGIDKRFESIDAKFEGIDKRLESIDAKFNQIMVDQQDMKEDIAWIKDKVMDTNETVTILVQKVGLHDIAIEKIKRKLMD